MFAVRLAGVVALAHVILAVEDTAAAVGGEALVVADVAALDETVGLAESAVYTILDADAVAAGLAVAAP